MNADSKNSPKTEKTFCKLNRTEFILVLVLTTVIFYLLYSKMENEIPQPVECSAPACYESIIEIQNFIDPTADPCEDFQQFVCGNFFENAYRKQIRSILAEEETELNNELDAMILEPIFSKDSNLVQIMKTFYSACMNVEEIDANNNKELIDLLDQTDGWPLRKGRNWKEKEFDWINVMVKCRELGLPFQWFLETGIHVEDLNYLKVSYPTFQNHTNGAKKTYMTKVLSSISGRNVNVNDIMDFDQRFTNVLKRQDSEIFITTVGELQEMHSLFDWSKFLNNLLGDIYEFSDETLIATNVGDYIISLHQLVRGTPKHTVANYIIWRILEHFAPYMSQPVRQHVPEFQDAERDELCKEKTKQNFPYFREIEYIRRYSTEEVKAGASMVASAISQEFLNRLEESMWWNSTAGQIYLDKFSDTEIYVGFGVGQDLIPDDDFLESNFLHIGELKLVENPTIIQVITERSKHYYKSLFSTLNQTGLTDEERQLLLHATEMDVSLNTELNKMVVPNSILRGFLYNYQRPQYLNYASLGTVLAREFIRSIQILTESDKDVTNVAFETSNKCFERDLLDLESEETIFNSSNMIEELLPDIVARDIAYSAYQTLVETTEEETELPFLLYTPNQLFWIKSSLINCHKKLEDETDLDLMLSKYRNILTVRHSRHFASDFGCSEKSAMNPPGKC